MPAPKAHMAGAALPVTGGSTASGSATQAPLGSGSRLAPPGGPPPPQGSGHLGLRGLVDQLEEKQRLRQKSGGGGSGMRPMQAARSAATLTLGLEPRQAEHAERQVASEPPASIGSSSHSSNLKSEWNAWATWAIEQHSPAQPLAPRIPATASTRALPVPFDSELQSAKRSYADTRSALHGVTSRLATQADCLQAEAASLDPGGAQKPSFVQLGFMEVPRANLDFRQMPLGGMGSHSGAVDSHAQQSATEHAGQPPPPPPPGDRTRSRGAPPGSVLQGLDGTVSVSAGNIVVTVMPASTAAEAREPQDPRKETAERRAPAGGYSGPQADSDDRPPVPRNLGRPPKAAEPPPTPQKERIEEVASASRSQPSQPSKERTGRRPSRNTLAPVAEHRRETHVMGQWSCREKEQHAQNLIRSLLPGEDGLLTLFSDVFAGTPLPSPWLACRNERGEVVFMNSQTGDSSWQSPLDGVVKEVAVLCRTFLGLPSSQRNSCISSLQQQWDTEITQELTQWTAVQDRASGQQYYYHLVSKDTMWQPPAEVFLPAHYFRMKVTEIFRYQGGSAGAAPPASGTSSHGMVAPATAGMGTTPNAAMPVGARPHASAANAMGAMKDQDDARLKSQRSILRRGSNEVLWHDARR